MYEYYIDVVKSNLNLEPDLMYFKSDPNYNAILEHVSVGLGYEYIRYIKDEYREVLYLPSGKINELLIELVKENDRYGKPNKHNFFGFVECSPSNLRYIYHSLLILDWMSKNNLNNIDIVEIGGGYGGLCFYLHKMSHLYNISIRSYTIFDLEEVCKLQEKYLSLLNINVKTADINNFSNINNDSFLISNYAFSEISEQNQFLYKEKLLDKYINYGFLVWNTDNRYNFINSKKLIWKNERPQTGVNNLFVYVKPLDNTNV